MKILTSTLFLPFVVNALPPIPATTVPTTLKTQVMVAPSTPSIDSHKVVSDGIRDINTEVKAILRRNGINHEHVVNITNLNTRGWPDVCNADLGDVPAYFDLDEQAQVVCCPSGSTWAYYGGNEIGIVCCGPTGIDSCNWAPVPAEVRRVSHKPNCGAIAGARYNKGGNWPVCILPHHKREGEPHTESASAVAPAIEARGWPNVCAANSIPQYFDQSGGHYVICCASDSNWAEPHASPLGTYISCCSIAPSQPGLCKVVPKVAGLPKCGNIAGAYNQVFNDPNAGASNVCLLPHGAEAGTQSTRSLNTLQARAWPNVCLENQVPQYFDAFDQPHVVCCPTDSNSAYWDNTNGPSCCKPDPNNPDGPCVREDAITKNDDNFPECSNIPGASLDLRSGIHTCKLPHSKKAVKGIAHNDAVGALRTRAFADVCGANQLPQYFGWKGIPHVVCCPPDSVSAYINNLDEPRCCKPNAVLPGTHCLDEVPIKDTDDNFPACSNIPGAMLDILKGVHTCALPSTLKDD